MSSSNERAKRHQEDKNFAESALKTAIERATQNVHYNSRTTRTKILQEFTSHTGFEAPYEWQLNVAEALLVGLDCTVIAGTGAGKTMPFVMPLFAQPKKVVLIISPLNALEEDQARRFREMKLTALALNGETYDNKVHKQIEEGKFQVIITSPEMCLRHDGFRKILSSPSFGARVLSIVIDEAHCISQWGKDFRPEYAQLGTLRSFVPAQVPFLVTSATLPQHVLLEVQNTVHIQKEYSYHLDLGINRPNIAWFVQRMKGAKKDLDSLSFLIPPQPNSTKAIHDLTQTFVFFDEINVALEALNYLREKIGQEGKHLIQVYHSRRSQRAKKRLLKRFRSGKIKILLTTEAAGMGCDLPNIARVVQYMVPTSLGIWMQRAGRAGRDPSINAEAVLLVQPSVFQEVKNGRKKGAIGDVYEGHEQADLKFRKDVESGLRRWIETEGCRREESAIYFDDGGERQAPTRHCCDNCLRRRGSSHPLLQPRAGTANPAPNSPIPHPTPSDSTLPVATTSIEDPSITEPSQTTINQNGKRSMTTDPPSNPSTPTSTANRREEHLNGARNVLKEWRYKTWVNNYSQQDWGVEALLPDKVLTNIATHTRSLTLEGLKKEGMSPLFIAEHGDDLIKQLAAYDSAWHLKHENEKQQRSEAKKQATIKRREEGAVAKKAEKEAKRALQQSHPKPARPSRGRKIPFPSQSLKTTSSSEVENIPPNPTPTRAISMPQPPTPTASYSPSYLPSMQPSLSFPFYSPTNSPLTNLRMHPPPAFPMSLTLSQMPDCIVPGEWANLTTNNNIHPTISGSTFYPNLPESSPYYNSPGYYM